MTTTDDALTMALRDQAEFHTDMARLRQLKSQVGEALLSGGRIAFGPSVEDQLRANMSPAALRAVFGEWP